MRATYTICGAKLGGDYAAYEIDKALRKNAEKFTECVEIHLQPQPVPVLQPAQPPPMVEKSTFRIYLAEFDDPDIPNRMKIIFAQADEDALEQALSFTDEYEGISLLHLTEVDENYHDIRIIEF